MSPPETTAPRPVLIAARHYAPEPTGSAPVVQQTAEWLAFAGYDVELLTVRPNYPEARIFPGYERGQLDNAVEGGVRVRRFPTMPVKGSGVMARAGAEVRFMAQLLVKRATGAQKPSPRLISLCPSILTVVGALPLRSRGGRHVAIVHDIQSGLGSALGGGGQVMAVLRRVEAWALNRVDHVVVLSEAMAQALRDIGVQTPTLVVPPHIDAKTISPRPRPFGAPPTLMYSGNLGRKQGLSQLVDLAAILKREQPGVRILIRGEGAMRAELVGRLQAEDLGNVRLEPLVAQDAVAGSMAEGDVHLVPQLAGGKEFAVPSKAFAIMAAGRPFVATADPSSPLYALARDVGACVCVEPGNAKAFADAAMSLLRDPERCARMAAAGRAHVEREADTPVVMAKIAALLEPDPMSRTDSGRGRRSR